MLRACQYCGKIHEIGYICPQKPQKKSGFKKGGTPQDRFRGKQAWKNKRREIKQRDMNMCRLCLTGRFTKDHKPVIVTDKLSVHHIRPLENAYEYRLDNDWLITLCDDCHELAEAGKVSAEYLHSLAIDTNFINDILTLC
ncbi:MAG: HNH endonuclease [Ruminococcus sp.]|nr:HNH endonuclease [Ruminococcus sp.]